MIFLCLKKYQKSVLKTISIRSSKSWGCISYWSSNHTRQFREQMANLISLRAASCDSDLLDLRKTDFSLVMKTHWQSKGNCFENQYLDNIGITTRDFKANGNNTQKKCIPISSIAYFNNNTSRLRHSQYKQKMKKKTLQIA